MLHMPFEIHVGPNVRTSPYFDATVADGVRAFSVYNHMFIPGNFGDPDAEYDRLINGVAMWDVAAQRQVEIAGPDAERLVQAITTRDVARAAVGQGRYVCVCDHDGIVLNDPVLLRLSAERFWLSIADSDISLWAKAVARERGLDVRVVEPDASPLAIQGPKAMDVARDLFGSWVDDLRYFGFRETALDGIPLVVARSGWSKQGGVELYLTDGSRGGDLWARVKLAGRPYGIGPGAPNDLERLESGLYSYGADGRYQTCPVNPFEIGLGALVDLDGDDFIGRDALVRIKAEGPARRRTGVVLDGPPVAGNARPVALRRGDDAIGVVTEVAYSKRLERSIGHALVAVGTPDDGLTAMLDDGPRPARLADLPFIKTP
jgi:glycine cleavage system aminomethyltransferase T